MALFVPVFHGCKNVMILGTDDDCRKNGRMTMNHCRMLRRMTDRGGVTFPSDRSAFTKLHLARMLTFSRSLNERQEYCASVTKMMTRGLDPGSTGMPSAEKGVGLGATKQKWSVSFLIPGFLVLCVVSLGLISRAPLVQAWMADSVRRMAILTDVYGLTRVAIAMGLLHCVAIVLCFPGTLLIELAAGYALGFQVGFVSMHVSKVLAAMVCFALGRTVLAEWVRRQRARFPQFSRILDAVQSEGAPMMLYMRLSPVPSFMNNYLLSALDVPFRYYALTTFLGTVPSLLPIISAGAGARDLSMVALGGAGANAPAWAQILRHGSMMLGVVLLASTMARIFKRVMNSKMGTESLGHDSKTPRV